LVVGSGFRVKGLDRAIRSLSELDDATRAHTRLVVVGQNRPTEFAMLARKLGVSERVHFLGGRHDVFDWLLASDLLVHPARSEAAGMILLEALTAGLPVLATDVCGYAFPHSTSRRGPRARIAFLAGAMRCRRSRHGGFIERESGAQTALPMPSAKTFIGVTSAAVELIESIAR